MPIPKAFFYNDKLYLRAIPVKKLFNSTTIHNVITRGDIFALCVEDNSLTVVPGNAQIIPATFEKIVENE